MITSFIIQWQTPTVYTDDQHGYNQRIVKFIVRGCKVNVMMLVLTGNVVLGGAILGSDGGKMDGLS